jgi:hypothetical protein
MPKRIRMPLAISIAWIAVVQHATAQETTGFVSTGLSIISIAASRPVSTTDGQRHLLYELLFRNNGQDRVRIERIEVSALGTRRTFCFEGEALASVLAYQNPDRSSDALAPGGLAIAYFDIAWPRSGRLPDAFSHWIATSANTSPARVPGPTVDVVDDDAAPLGPPLKRGDLVPVNGCCDSGHRRAVFAIDGHLHLAQRYAIDLLAIDRSGSFSGDPTKNESYFVYGAEALAVAAGQIVSVSDGMAENIPTEPLPPPSLDTIAGNHVILAMPDGRFALYAHLQPGSIRVQPGDQVSRGQALGLVGNSGNSTEPHLHFHVMDGPSALASNGRPYTFEAFDLVGVIDESGPEPTIQPVPPPRLRRSQLPMGADIIAF